MPHSSNDYTIISARCKHDVGSIISNTSQCHKKMQLHACIAMAKGTASLGRHQQRHAADAPPDSDSLSGRRGCSKTGGSSPALLKLMSWVSCLVLPTRQAPKTLCKSSSIATSSAGTTCRGWHCMTIRMTTCKAVRFTHSDA